MAISTKTTLFLEMEKSRYFLEPINGNIAGHTKIVIGRLKGIIKKHEQGCVFCPEMKMKLGR